MKIVITQVSKGSVIDDNGQLFEVTKSEHTKPGKGPAYIQITMKNLVTGKKLDKRFNSSATVETVVIDNADMEYLYRDGESFVFMNVETYEQAEVSEAICGEAMKYLPNNSKAIIKFNGDQPLILELPAAVVLTITEADPAVKVEGNVLKSATVETGLIVKVPMHINVGDRIRINTETGEYSERVND